MTGSTAGVVDDDGNEASTDPAGDLYRKRVEQQKEEQREEAVAAEISNLPEFEETLERHGWSLAWIEKQTLSQGWGSPREWRNDTRMRFIQKEAWTQFSLPEENVN